MRFTFQKSATSVKGHFTPELKGDLALTFIVMIAGLKLNMQKLGKKGKEWLKAKPKLIQIYLAKGITRCENCGSKFIIDFHHRPSRASQEAVHDFEHTRLLCQECHTFFEHNEEFDIKLFAKPRGYDPQYKIDIMAEKEKVKTKKADWQRPHKCKHCKQIVSMLICPNCGEASI